MCVQVYKYIYLFRYIFIPPNMICCSLDLVSRLRTGYMVSIATDSVLGNSTAQSNLSVSVHYIIKSTENDLGFLILNLVI